MQGIAVQARIVAHMNHQTLKTAKYLPANLVDSAPQTCAHRHLARWRSIGGLTFIRDGAASIVIARSCVSTMVDRLSLCVSLYLLIPRTLHELCVGSRVDTLCSTLS